MFVTYPELFTRNPQSAECLNCVFVCISVCVCVCVCGRGRDGGVCGESYIGRLAKRVNLRDLPRKKRGK